MAKITPLPKAPESSSAKEARKLLGRASTGKKSAPQTVNNGSVARPVSGTKVQGATQASGGTL